MRQLTACGLAATAIIAAILSGCATTSPPVQGTTTPTGAPCTERPELLAAIDTLFAAQGGGNEGAVYGQAGGRQNNLVTRAKPSDVAAMMNPKGDGVLLSIVTAGDGAFAADTAHRSAWLILGGIIYPVNVDAAQAFGLLWDGYPDEVKRAAGLGTNYVSLEESYGVRDFISYNSDTFGDYEDFVAEANERCERTTSWGQ